MNSVWAYARTTAIAIKVGTGSTARCGALRFTVATRIAIPSLAIDLPIVKSPSGYPLCNVAMYLKELSQPGEAGVSFIYAHARKGMFLPLLDRSKVNNGASLIGMTVKVWTSNDVVTTYEITQGPPACDVTRQCVRPRDPAALDPDVGGPAGHEGQAHHRREADRPGGGHPRGGQPDPASGRLPVGSVGVVSLEGLEPSTR